MIKRIAVIGIVGIPSRYGGFETLTENLVRYVESSAVDVQLTVYCSSIGRKNGPSVYCGAYLRYVRLKANGISSVFYDALSILMAVRAGTDTILVLGVSGALIFPFLRLLTNVRIVTNIDGVEWKRRKWGILARQFLWLSERIAVKMSHIVITDNEGISQHVKHMYGVNSTLISYGGDHAIKIDPLPYYGVPLPKDYALALCRIEPENNVELILDAFSTQSTAPLVFIGNWAASSYGRRMRVRYGHIENLLLLDPIYDLGVLRTVRGGAKLYVHGHSAGGTNPALVEMMHFNLPILVFDCVFNRHTTDNKAFFFKTTETLRDLIETCASDSGHDARDDILYIARERYTWLLIGQRYVEILTMDCLPIYD